MKRWLSERSRLKTMAASAHPATATVWRSLFHPAAPGRPSPNMIRLSRRMKAAVLIFKERFQGASRPASRRCGRRKVQKRNRSLIIRLIRLQPVSIRQGIDPHLPSPRNMAPAASKLSDSSFSASLKQRAQKLLADGHWTCDNMSMIEEIKHAGEV